MENLSFSISGPRAAQKPRNPELKPPFRRLRIYAFDPAASLDIQTAVINTATISLRWEELEPGPVGEYVEVIDVDPASGGFYPPVDLNETALLVQDGYPPSDGNPRFHQQMVYAVAMMTIRNFERALGRPVLWAPRPWDWETGEKIERYVQRLRIYPHALREANAYYSPRKAALLFGYFQASRRNAGRNLPGGTIFTCLSHDIVAHETTHAILDGMHRRFIEPSNPDTLAFHEAFADIVALFQHFTLPEAVRQQIAQLRGDLSQRSLLSGLAVQFGHAIGHYGALRDAIDAVDPETGMPDATAIDRATESHERGAILVAAVFDAFVSIYRSRVADLLRLTTGDGRRFPDRDLHPDLVARLTREATKSASHVLRMCIRAVDYLPPVDMTFGDYLRALITADYDLVTEDDRGYRLAIIEAFRRRGIFPRDCRSLSVDSLLWSVPENPIEIDWITDINFSQSLARKEIYERSAERCQSLAHWMRNNADISHETLREMGLWLRDDAPKTIRRARATETTGPGPAFEIHSVRLANRIGPDGEQERQLVIEITQERRGYRSADLQREVEERGRVKGVRADFVFRGGATLIVDLRTRALRYCIKKDIASDERLDEQRSYRFEADSETLGSTYFGDTNEAEPFAFVHRLGGC
ncbi:hypothetical protein FB009_1506 [Sinorhizobium medicae]|uniref:hypothetical protein n=1 Tax=Sinorhizobium medicae TaxID=110321 RepID=UPI00119C0353|nr:hypothetical protein [Sinorhizobium medicae]MDX0439446.1 hypothetical protein [Sinorhizobium medicae]MDX0913456.1 hypothetical protein [Sinorhizobium medicae]MDX1091165.1 hypothetical protein [Sinorhizobium medicae]MDX1116146.1 hypothetical protein [Sinorhizobium medicae]MQU75212.1 hypothetical protein [Sinorhizobium medicae]